MTRHLLIAPQAAILATVLLTACSRAPGTSAELATGESPLTAVAQDALDRGIAAARFRDYPFAVQHFERAWTLAPDAPIVYYNLGLAESRIPSHELRAMSWFGAYLAARPEAPNASLVKAEIALLETRSRGFIDRVVEELGNIVVDAAPLFVRPDVIAQRPDPSECFRAIRLMAGLIADAGDVASAVELEAPYVACSRPYPYAASSAAEFWATIAVAQAGNGDVAGARAMAAKIPRTETAHVNSTRSYIDSREGKADSSRLAGGVSDAALRGWFSHLGAERPSDTGTPTENARSADCEDAGLASNNCPILDAAPFVSLARELDALVIDDPMKMYQGLWIIARQLVDGHRLVTTKLKRQIGAL